MQATSTSCVSCDVEPTERDEQLRVRASKANPAAEHEDFRLLVGPFARALDELRARRRAGTDTDTERASSLIARIAVVDHRVGIVEPSGEFVVRFTAGFLLLVERLGPFVVLNESIVRGVTARALTYEPANQS